MSQSSAASGRRPYRRVIVALAAILGVLVVALGGGAFAYAKSFDDKARPGTTVLGTDVSGRTSDQIAQLVSSRAAAAKVQVTAGATKKSASLADLGVTVDARATAARAVANSEGVGGVLTSLLGKSRTIAPVVTVDDAKSTAFAGSLVPDDQSKGRDAGLVYDEGASAFTVLPGKAGKGIDPAALTRAVKAHAASVQSFSVDLPVTDRSPAVSDDDAKATADRLNGILDQDRVITGPQNASHKVGRDTLASWITVKPGTAPEKFSVSYDDSKITQWVQERAKKDAVEKVDGIEQVDATGKTTAVVAQKKDGIAITNADQIAKDLVTSIRESKPFSAAFQTKADPATVIKAKAPEATPTPSATAPATPSTSPTAATGEKWIDVNLSKKTVTAYVGDTPVWGPVSIVDGKAGYGTVQGSFKIYMRLDKQDMTNGNTVAQGDPRYYYTKDVPWVQYFHGGYAFHGAPWRSSFGYSGSHGCINMRPSDAKWLYDWASKGTRVEVHR